MAPFFSIIIPVYNVAPYLRECLDSVLNQTFADWEAICVDDGSSDGSGDILDEYAVLNSRFKVIHQKNAGSSAARNAGIGKAQGEWIWFVDADDWIEKDSLEKFVSSNRKCDINFRSMRLSYQDGFKNILVFPSLFYSTEEAINQAVDILVNSKVGDVFGWTCDKLIKSSVIKHNLIHFDENISYYEDEVFTMQLFEHAESVSVCSDVVYNYRILKTGLTARGIPNAMKLADAFALVGRSSRLPAIQYLAFRRAFFLIWPMVLNSWNFEAAKKIIDLYRSYSHLSKLNEMHLRQIAVLAKLPVPLASFLLLLIQKVKKII